MRIHYFYIFAVTILTILTGAVCFGSELLVLQDEQNYFTGSLFYQNNWITPDLTSDIINFTRAYNGTSYLEYLDFMFLLYGKFSKLSPLLNISEWQLMRLLNFSLLIVLCLYVLRSKYCNYLIISIASAAVFYIFAYINTDAMTHLLSVLLVGAYFAQVESNKDKSTLLGILSGLLLCAKLNYLTVFACIFVLLFFNKTINFKRYILIFSAIFACRYSLNLINNDFNWFTKMEAVHAKNTDPYYGPYIDGTPSHWNINLKKKGYSLIDMTKKYDWFSTSFNTMFMFRCLMKVSLIPVKDFILITSLLFLIFMYVISRSAININCGIIFAFIILTISLSLYRSWTLEFQPQGRYLFAIFPLLSLLAFHAFGPGAPPRKYLNVNVLFLSCAILMSYYIYQYNGLQN